MKKILILMSFFLYSSLEGNSQNSDTTAYQIIEKHLNLIEKYLNDNMSDPSLRRMASMYFLYELTGIPSESPGNYVGQYQPTKNDLFYWRHWYKENKSNISWDPKLKKIIYRKEVAVPKTK